jgi:hypothetical protein
MIYDGLRHLKYLVEKRQKRPRLYKVKVYSHEILSLHHNIRVRYVGERRPLSLFASMGFPIS